MKEHFPRIDWYFCSVEGVLTVRPQLLLSVMNGIL
jgi:hypothetical protein